LRYIPCTMKLRYILLICLLSVFYSGLSQILAENDDLFSKNLNLVHKDPEQTLRVAHFLQKNTASNEQMAKGYYLISEYAKIKGEYLQRTEAVFKGKNLLDFNKPGYLHCLYLAAISDLCQDMGLNELAVKYLGRAENILKDLPKSENTSIATARINLERARSLVLLNDLPKSLYILEKNKVELRTLYKSSPALFAENIIEKGTLYLHKKIADSARLAFNNALVVLWEHKMDESSLEAMALLGLGKVFIIEQNYTEALETLKEAAMVPVVEPEAKMSIYKELSEVYLAVDSVEISREFNQKSTELSTSVTASERNARNTLVSYIEKDQVQQLESDISIYYRIGGIILLLLILIAVLYYFYNRKLNKEYKKFERIIARIENKEKLVTISEASDSPPRESKGVNIPEETEKAILKRLKEFESSRKFTHSGMSLQYLAKELNTNTKYISEIIHSHKGKNFNTYINELRVNYIIKMMRENKQYLNYKVSYLAEESGFSSHSAFTVVFKSITGITPNQFINFLKKESKIPSHTF
jgi:YesN/AraC family two-component response regulator